MLQSLVYVNSESCSRFLKGCNSAFIVASVIMTLLNEYRQLGKSEDTLNSLKVG